MKRAIGRLAGFAVLLAVLAALVAGGALLVSRKKRALRSAPRFGVRPTPVRVASAREGDLLVTRDYLAVVTAFRTAAISARVTAPLLQIPVDEGDAVAEGDVLAVLDGREIRDGIAALDAEIERSRAELEANEATVASLSDSAAYWEREAERDRKLVEKGDIPSSAAEATADRANVVRGQLKAARGRSDALRHGEEALRRQRAALETRLGYCTLRSPYHGIVTRRLADPGDLAAPGRKLFVVEDRCRLKAVFDVPQSDLPAVRAGLPVRFRTGDGAREAKLDELFPSLDLDRTLRAEVLLDSARSRGLDVGAYLPLSVVVENRTGVTLAPAAVLVPSPEGSSTVFRVRDGRLETVPVTVVGRSGDEVALTGVAPGDTLVTSTFLGWARLSRGIPVEAIR